MKGWRADRKAGERSAFTLIEVILAIVIAVGLLSVVLYFYRQAADLRGQIVVESERLGSVRLVMSRLTDELRTVVPRAGKGIAPLVGNAQGFRLIQAAVPARIAWEGGDLGRALGPDSDLVVVSYRATPGTNSPGLYRREQVLVGTPPPLAPPAADEAEDSPAISPPDGFPGGTNGAALPSDGSLTNPFASRELLLTDVIPFARFRFWDGTGWRDTWADSRLPVAVEVILALEMPPVDAPPGALPENYHRRVVTIPAAWGAGASDPAAAGEDPSGAPTGGSGTDPFAPEGGGDGEGGAP